MEAYGRSCEYFTMVREPIDRLVSAFYFCPDNKVIKDNRPKKVPNVFGNDLVDSKSAQYVGQ